MRKNGLDAMIGAAQVMVAVVQSVRDLVGNSARTLGRDNLGQEGNCADLAGG